MASAAQAGYLAVVVVTGLVAGAPGPVALAVGVTIGGASAGGTWAPFSDAVSRQVPETAQPRALSLVNTGAPLGSVLASIGVLVAGGTWRLAWTIFAALGLAAAVVNLRVLAPRRPARCDALRVRRGGGS